MYVGRLYVVKLWVYVSVLTDGGWLFCWSKIWMCFGGFYTGVVHSIAERERLHIANYSAYSIPTAYNGLQWNPLKGHPCINSLPTNDAYMRHELP